MDNETIYLSLAQKEIISDSLGLVNNQKMYQQSIINLKEILNLTNNDSIDLVERETPDPLIQNTSPLYFPDVHMIDSEEKVQNSFLKEMSAEILPKLYVNLGYGTNYSSLSTNFNDLIVPFWTQFNNNRSFYFTSRLSFPILGFFKTKRQVSKIKIEILRLKAERELKQLENERNYELLRLEYENSNKEYKIHKSNLTASKNSFETISKRYASGIATSLEYSQLQNEYKLAEFNVIRSKYMVNYFRELILIMHEQNPSL